MDNSHNSKAITPNFKLVKVGEQVILSSSLDNSDWVLEGDKKGSLAHQSHVGYIYTAPRSPDSAEPLKKSDDIRRLWAEDIVTAFHEGQYYSATMLLPKYPGPYEIEVSAVGKQKFLKLIRIMRTGEREEVPLTNTRWHIAAGHGRVESKDGSFYSSGDHPSAAAAVMAIDERDQYNWAYTIRLIEPQ